MNNDFTNVEVLGLDELEHKLGELDNQLAGKAIYGALNYALTPVVKEAKQRARTAKEPHAMVINANKRKVEIQPGLLASAVKKRRVPKSEMTGEFATGAAMGVYIGTGTKQKFYPQYWPFIEHGTSTQPATPFIRPSFDNNVDLMLSRFSEKLSENIDKYGE